MTASCHHEPPAKRPVSARKLAANRANACKSTGPRTAEGKAVAAFNAVKHGLAAQTALLPGENPVELLKLRAEYESYYGNSSPVEKALLARMVAVNWKLKRLARAEEQMVEHEFDEQLKAWAGRRGFNAARRPEDRDYFNHHDPMPQPRDGATLTADACKSRDGQHPMERLCAWESKLTGQLVSVTRQLVALQKQVAKERGEREQGEQAAPPKVAWTDLLNEPHTPPLPSAAEQARLAAFPAELDALNTATLQKLEEERTKAKAAGQAEQAAVEAAEQESDLASPAPQDQPSRQQVVQNKATAGDFEAADAVTPPTHPAYISEQDLFHNARWLIDNDASPAQSKAGNERPSR